MRPPAQVELEEKKKTPMHAASTRWGAGAPHTTPRVAAQTFFGPAAAAGRLGVAAADDASRLTATAFLGAGDALAGVAALTFFAGGDFVAAALPFFAGVAWNWQQMEPWNERQVTTGWQAAEGPACTAGDGNQTFAKLKKKTGRALSSGLPVSYHTAATRRGKTSSPKSHIIVPTLHYGATQDTDVHRRVRSPVTTRTPKHTSPSSQAAS